VVFRGHLLPPVGKKLADNSAIRVGVQVARLVGSSAGGYNGSLMAISSYQEALDYLYSFVDYSVERSYRYSPEVFDLGRVRELLRRLGNPQDSYPAFHIAGTKGKGSVSALIESALRASGRKTGLYSSPHLIRFTERIQIEGDEIPEDAVADVVARLQPHVKAVPGLTTYELITAAAFQYFADEKVDCAVIEVGLGGRLDATNVIIPKVAVITSISYDHTHLLGDSLSEIAAEKGGIIKPGVPVVLAPQQHEAQFVLEQIAAERHSPLVQAGRDWLFAAGSHDLQHQTLYVWSPDEQPLMDRFVETAGGEEWVPLRLDIPLLGYHQVVNSAVAYAALQTGARLGLPLPTAAIQIGFRQVSWPGRFQVLSHDPAVVVDSAHNRDSALKLRLALDDYFPGNPVTLIFGASADKDIPGMMTELLPRVSRLITTQAVHPRAADPQELANLGRSRGAVTQVIVPVAEALRQALATRKPGEVILAAGSLFVAGEVLAAWDEAAAAAGIHPKVSAV
jgi:dihydrofolate synthase/folylpolyglutamate synthase